MLQPHVGKRPTVGLDNELLQLYDTEEPVKDLGLRTEEGICMMMLLVNGAEFTTQAEVIWGSTKTGQSAMPPNVLSASY